ncbi:MAG: RNA polymerase sigma factor [Sedimentisphaerales bacterium]|nr:RNA polymerase sigma factor [Sedimentisphaerales bacterium]
MAENNDISGIIAGCKSGDCESFSRLVDIYARRCHGYFYRMTGNSDVSDDLLSQLFVRLVEKIVSYKSGSFESWLFKIASNIFYDYLRQKQRNEKAVKIRKEQLRLQRQGLGRSDCGKIDKLQVELAASTLGVLAMTFNSLMKIKCVFLVTFSVQSIVVINKKSLSIFEPLFEMFLGDLFSLLGC